MNTRKYSIFHIKFKLFALVHISYSSIEEFILNIFSNIQLNKKRNECNLKSKEI